MKQFFAGLVGSLALAGLAQAGELQLSVSNDMHHVDRNLYVSATSTEGGNPVVHDQIEMAIGMDGMGFTRRLTKPTNSEGVGQIKLVPRTVQTINVCAVSVKTGAFMTLSIDIVP